MASRPPGTGGSIDVLYARRPSMMKVDLRPSPRKWGDAKSLTTSVLLCVREVSAVADEAHPHIANIRYRIAGADVDYCRRTVWRAAQVSDAL